MNAFGVFLCGFCVMFPARCLNSITGLSRGVIVSFALRIETFVFVYIYVIQMLQDYLCFMVLVLIL